MHVWLFEDSKFIMNVWMWVWMFVCNLTFEMKKIIAKHLFCWHCIHLKLRGISRHVKTRFSYEIFELYCIAFSCWSCLILWLEHVGGHSKHAVCCKLSPGQTLGTTTLEARNDSGRWKYILPHFNTKLHLHEYTPDMRLLQGQSLNWKAPSIRSLALTRSGSQECGSWVIRQKS